ncbi:protein ACCELERATED CELL DEATH 6-like [Cornus florida]|uniref:protein ACCELERATED CELL DEATH 6-like n=1 Tax=Cornus florida TaxID=4283 RepID=UPI00289F6B69|nr:protein ACCELERATED CELL DEATH 6-like [Cornus florida]
MLHDWKPSLIKEADVCGWRPLHYAAFLGNTSKIKQLLLLDKSVAYLVADNDNNNTTLHIAASQGHIDVMEALLLSCPDCWEMKNNKDQNILHIAIENDQEEAIIEFILAKPFRSSLLNQKDIDGNTPLHLLAAKSSKHYLYDLTKNLRRVDKMVCNKKNLTSSAVRYGDLNPYQVRMMGCRNKFNSRKTNSILARLGRTAAENNLVVATLTATVSFAAGFTVPGVYDGNEGPNQGMAVLTRRAAFNVFVLADAFALIFSVSTVLIHIFASSYEDKDDRIIGLGMAFYFILYAMIAMVIAFITGLYAVLPNSSAIATSVVVICSVYCLSALYYAFLLPQFGHELRIQWFRSTCKLRRHFRR